MDIQTEFLATQKEALACFIDGKINEKKNEKDSLEGVKETAIAQAQSEYLNAENVMNASIAQASNEYDQESQAIQTELDNLFAERNSLFPVESVEVTEG